MNPLGTLLVVSGPSGSGKTTLCRRATDEGRCRYSISCTTRAPREGEINGRDYHFLSAEKFEELVNQGEFLEHALVHGNRYGTLKQDIVPLLMKGENVIMDIDVQGANQVRSNGDAAIRRAYADVYIHVSPRELESRLRGRGTDSEDVIRLRLENALEEDTQISLYQYILESGAREEDYYRFTCLLSSLSLRACLRQFRV